MPVLPRPISSILAVVAAAATVSAVGYAQTMGSPERFTANAVNMNRGAAGNIEIVINRWSTDAQRDKLMAVMLEKGPDKLLDALQDMPRMGYFRTPGQVGIDIHFARRLPLPEGGERVVL